MKSSQADLIPTLNPEAFSNWVQRVASVNEQFAEALHNAADIIAMHDPDAAMALYQAVDVATDTVQALRTSKPLLPKEKATTKPAVALGANVGLMMTFLLDLI